MVMDRNSTGLFDYQNDSKFDETIVFPISDQHPETELGLELNTPSPDLSFINLPFDPPDSDPDSFRLSFNLNPAGVSSVPSMSLSPDGSGSLDPLTGLNPEAEASSSSEDSDFTDPLLKYISQMLMEENMKDQPHMFHDHFALSATEKSLYDALGEQYPPSPNSSQSCPRHDSPNSNISATGSYCGDNTSNSTSTCNCSATTDFSKDSQRVSGDSDVGGSNPSFLRTSLLGDNHFQSNLRPNMQFSANPSNGITNTRDSLMGPSAGEMAQDMFSDMESVLQFKRGLEEASKFLPSASQLVIDLETNTFSTWKKEETPRVVVKEEKSERDSSPNGSRGRKNHEREDWDLEEGRSNKQSAVHVEEGELSEMFDKVLLWTGGQCCGNDADQEVGCKSLQPDEQSNGSSGGKSRSKRQNKRMETVDLRTLLILCAQAISTDDSRNANELLKQIRQHSSPLGDGTQRLAHFFANGLEARLFGSGNGAPNYFSSLTSKRTTAADMLKAYKTQLQACPFKKLSIAFAIKMILHAAEKATTLHIVDFGVLYGFQWPSLIQQLSLLPNGPPKLRLTGIELPQHGFRPSERIEETGRRLANYCERFKVPFEYNPITAQNWEKIPIEDLKINRNEVLAVNCLFRFKNLLDETVEVDCPKDAVLKLIRKMNPDIFVHAIVSGSYNAPFFLTRFREALFHFSSLFDILDSTLPREDQERMMFEREFFGQDAMNVIACEGQGRVERPETYKQWQVRTLRAGFKPLPFDQELMTKFKGKLKSCYHKDFVIDEDNNWMLQGWKGRIIFASSCWVPA
ncbi:hypothetical protein OIU78_007937 [Salix suchowensis]|nr:scarecrow protein [Salix suchowensis]KAJ6345160.1 hypothetical protein OIU78_007937 [Salix suchowensis]KAJ6345161.1 hypothetical protein OIU78_007937 [Salix suchowensis]